jgi:sulfopyruvate decarboxylase subunit alpha
VTVVAAVPESLLAGVYRMCAKDNAIRYIPVTNEAELPGICAGTYLAGKKAIMVMENSGLRQACEPIARFAYCYAMPLVMAMSFRGEWGERNWWGHNHAQTMEPTLGKERPANLTVVVMDGIYENIGGPPTHTSFNADLAKMADGAGCLNCVTVREADEFDRQFRRMLDDDQMGYLVAKIEPFAKHKWEWKDRKATDGVEDKYRFLRYVEKLEGVVIHPGAVQN